MIVATPAPVGYRIVVIALAAALACSAPPDLDKELTSVRSWTATAHLAAEDERRGAISHRLAAQLRERAVEARHDAEASIAAAAASADGRRRARTALDSLDAAIRRLDTQVVAR
jgi:hypothetical protein